MPRVITTHEHLDEMVEAYRNVDEFVFDVETWGPHRGDPRRNDVAWISLATYGRSDVIPMDHPHGEYVRTDYPLKPSAQSRIERGLPLRPSDYSIDERKATKLWTPRPEQLPVREVFAALRPLMFSDQLKVGHNIKFDIESIAKYYGGIIMPPFACTLVATFLLDNRSKNHLGLGDRCRHELGYEMKKGVGKEIEAHSFSKVAKYSRLDSKYTWLLWRELKQQLAETRLTKLFTLEMDVLEVLCHMEMRGAVVDRDELVALRERLEADIDAAKGAIYVAAGKAFNMNSNAEKQRLLFGAKAEGGQGLKPRVFTANGAPSVAAPALEPYRERNKLAAALLGYQDLNKLLSTYVVPYLGGTVERTTAGKTKTVEKESLLHDGRLHTDFVQYGTETGRFSSRNPNLQNIPRPDTEYGKVIRNLFRAKEGDKLIVADYSQIEPRVIASFSEDPVMMAAYLDPEGPDFYTAIASPFGLPRQAGKVLYLSMSYGLGPDNLATKLDLSLSEAKTLLGDFDRKFKSVGRYKAAVIREVRSRRPPHVTTVLGRRRYLPTIFSKEPGARSAAERQAFNTKIQGSAADLIKLALVRAQRAVPDGCQLILTIHDEIVTEAPAHLAEECAEAIRQAMEGIHLLKVPLVADIKVVDRWGEAK